MSALLKQIQDLPTLSAATAKTYFAVQDNGVTSKLSAFGLPGSRDIRQYGAVGTDDDTTVMNLALADTASGGYVEIPAGVVVTIDNVTLDSRAIKGDGTLRWKAGSTRMLTMTGLRPRLVGITIDGQSNDHGTNVAIITTNCTKPRFRKLEVYNFRYKFFVSGIDDGIRGQLDSCNFYNCGQVNDCDVFSIRSSHWKVDRCDWEHVTNQGHMLRFGQFGVGQGSPVIGCSVNQCTFVDSPEVGIVGELYTQGLTIEACEFRSLAQGAKFENSGSTVSGIKIHNNEFRDLTLSTAFNWTVPGTYTANRCYNCAGGIEIFKDAIVAGNYLENCGNSSEGAIHLFSGGSGRFTIEHNTIVNPVGSGIVLGTSNCKVRGNTVYNVTASGKFGIDVDKDNQDVTGNTVDTVAVGATAIRVVSTCTNSQVTGNPLRNVSGTLIGASNSVSFRSVLVKDNPGATPLALDHNIVSDAFTIGLSSVDVVMNTESGGALDDLSTITAPANLPIGHVIILRDNSASQDVTVKHNVGNILLAGAADFAFTTSSNNQLGLMWTGSKWREIWRNP